MKLNKNNLHIIKNKWGKIFHNNDVFLNPFNKNIDYCILYPTNGYHLTEMQYNSVVKTSRELGEEGFWLAVTEYNDIKLMKNEVWWCSYPSYDNYLDYPLTLENSIFSDKCQWGVMVSHEDHALFGGIEDNLNIFKTNYFNWIKDRDKFSCVWKTEEWANNLLHDSK